VTLATNGHDRVLSFFHYFGAAAALRSLTWSASGVTSSVRMDSNDLRSPATGSLYGHDDEASASVTNHSDRRDAGEQPSNTDQATRAASPVTDIMTKPATAKEAALQAVVLQLRSIFDRALDMVGGDKQSIREELSAAGLHEISLAKLESKRQNRASSSNSDHLHRSNTSGARSAAVDETETDNQQPEAAFMLQITEAQAVAMEAGGEAELYKETMKVMVKSTRPSVIVDSRGATYGQTVGTSTDLGSFLAFSTNICRLKSCEAAH